MVQSQNWLTAKNILSPYISVVLVNTTFNTVVEIVLTVSIYDSLTSKIRWLISYQNKKVKVDVIIIVVFICFNFVLINIIIVIVSSSTKESKKKLDNMNGSRSKRNEVKKIIQDRFLWKRIPGRNSRCLSKRMMKGSSRWTLRSLYIALTYKVCYYDVS